MALAAPREARAEDVAAIAEMTAAASAQAGAPPPGLDAARLREAMFGADPVLRGIVAEGVSGPVGHLLFSRGVEVQAGLRTLWVADIYVRPAARRAGVGRALTAADRAWLQGGGLLPWRVDAAEKGTVRFYETLGARRDGGWPMVLVADGG